MTPQATKEDQPFAVVFETLRAAQTLAPETVMVRLMKIVGEDEPEWEKIDELRRLSESMAEPELRTYTIS